MVANIYNVRIPEQDLFHIGFGHLACQTLGGIFRSAGNHPVVILAYGHIHIAIKLNNRRLILLSHISQTGSHFSNLPVNISHQLFASFFLLANRRHNHDILFYTVQLSVSKRHHFKSRLLHLLNLLIVCGVYKHYVGVKLQKFFDVDSGVRRTPVRDGIF